MRGLFLLNGGGSLALLAMVTHSVGEDPARPIPFKGHLLFALSLMVLGLLLAAPINHLRYEASRRYDREMTKPAARSLGTIHRGLFYLSLASFAVGCAVLACGVWSWNP